MKEIYAYNKMHAHEEVRPRGGVSQRALLLPVIESDLEVVTPWCPFCKTLDAANIYIHHFHY